EKSKNRRAQLGKPFCSRFQEFLDIGKPVGEYPGLLKPLVEVHEAVANRRADVQKRSRDRGQHAEKPLKDLPTELQSLEADVQCCERTLCDPLNELECLSELRDVLRRPGDDRLFAAADSQNFR